MAKKQSFIPLIMPMCQRLAQEQGVELYDVALERENTGSYLRIYLDKEGGLSLDDCENYHRVIMPKVEGYDYDFLEVSSLGIDRPVKTEKDIEKAIGDTVEVKLYKPLEGQKLFQGVLLEMDATHICLQTTVDTFTFERKSVALVKFLPDLSALDVEE